MNHFFFLQHFVLFLIISFDLLSLSDLRLIIQKITLAILFLAFPKILALLAFKFEHFLLINDTNLFIS